MIISRRPSANKISPGPLPCPQHELVVSIPSRWRALTRGAMHLSIGFTAHLALPVWLSGAMSLTRMFSVVPHLHNWGPLSALAATRRRGAYHPACRGRTNCPYVLGQFLGGTLSDQTCALSLAQQTSIFNKRHN